MEKKDFIKSLNSSKYNLENQGSKLLEYRQHFFNLYTGLGLNNNSDHPYLDLVTILNSMSPSYLAPAYHYNRYVEALLTDIYWDDMKLEIAEKDWISSFLRRNTYQIEIQALLLAIKTALDRLVSVFYYYYKGITPFTTFGRINNEGKSRGFMGIVDAGKQKDNLLEYIAKEYKKWISAAVEPRDLIVHYNDLGIAYYFDSKALIEIPIHFNKRLIETKESREISASNFHYDNIYEISMNWYLFFANVLDHLLRKELVVQKVKI